MIKFPTIVFSVTVALFGSYVTACSKVQVQKMTIVSEVEDNGSGNISTATLPGLVHWFAERPQFASRIAKECDPLSKHADASWFSSKEGTACTAAQRVASATTAADVTADKLGW